MTQKTIKPIKAPSTEAVYAATTMLGQMPMWRQALKPLLDAAARDFGNRGNLASDVPKALNEFGRYCRTLSKEIKQAQAERARQTAAVPSATEKQGAPEPTRQVSARRTGKTAGSSPAPRGRPRKPAERE